MKHAAALGFLLAILASPVAASNRAEVRFQPETGGIEAAAWLALGPAAGEIVFRLARGLAVREASLDGRPVTLDLADGAWRLTTSAASGQVLEVRYGGSLPGEPTAEPPILGPAGGFLPAGSAWLPEVEGAPAAPFDLTLDVPQPYAAVATGRLVEESTADGHYRVWFEAEPAGGGPSAFVGVHTIRERRAGAVALRTYFPPEAAGLADLYLANAASYLDMLEARIGPYPYAGFAVVAGPLPVGLGFPGLAYVSQRILPLPFMQTTSLAHELLHGWWGNAVGVAYEAGNWAEGLTTYMADHALAERESPEKARAMRLAWLMDYAALPPERDIPLRAFVAKEHDASQVVGYGKAAFVFHMLRRLLGGEGFDRAVRSFYAAERGRRAAWADLERSFAAVAGAPLDRFFAQWLGRAGAPRLELGDARPRRMDGGWAVDLVLRQAEPAYALAVPVVIDTDQGSVRRTVTLESAEAALTLDLPSRPHRLAVDPDHDLFRRLPPGEAPPILRDVTLSGRTVVLTAVPDAATAGLAGELARRLLDLPADAGLMADAKRLEDAPVLVVGVAPAVAAKLAAAGLPPAPPEIAGRGTARAWAARRAGGAPVLVVEANDAGALRALLRPLPHYRRDSWLVLDGERVIARGAWPTGESPLTRSLDAAWD